MNAAGFTATTIGEPSAKQPTGYAALDLSTSPAATPAAKIVEEFQYLLEKSQQLFAGLRDLPPMGGPRQWQPYFLRSFEVYTKLWKFQQQHRLLLEDKENYGLKRWEVGEIASKIGQLYYHYYLRTSETTYLFEAYVFYEAIRERSYFRNVLDTKNPALVIKKLRYYARFVVVCLLMNRRDVVKSIVDELNVLVEEYGKAFRVTDLNEWQAVVQEVNAFTEAQKRMMPVDLEGTRLPVQHRLADVGSAVDLPADVPAVRLQEVLVVGNVQQVKFSELTIDMFRMLQALERVPSSQQKKTVPGEEAVPATSKRYNPHKYLLFRPTLSQLLVYAAAGFKELQEGAAMLLYFSSDGYQLPVDPNKMLPHPLFSGGMVTAQRTSSFASTKDALGKTPSAASEDTAVSADALQPAINCLHPGDLLPFTRKPLFLIVDSAKSGLFKEMPVPFNQPLVCLMSPVAYPPSFKENPSQNGSMFTMFLYNLPLGLAHLLQIHECTSTAWDWFVKSVAAMETMAQDLLTSTPTVDRAFKSFLHDDFLRKFLARFVVMSVALSVHVDFSGNDGFQPSCWPALPAAVVAAPSLHASLQQVVDRFKRSGYFEIPKALP